MGRGNGLAVGLASWGEGTGPRSGAGTGWLGWLGVWSGSPLGGGDGWEWLAGTGLSAVVNREAYVYILAGNKPDQGNPPIYVGSTTDLVQRVALHREGRGSRHTAKYRIKRLVWYEAFDSIDDAQTVERRLKRWNREWKDDLIEELNPEWRDLYLELA